MSCAKLFGCAINVEAEEEGGGGGDDSSISVEVSRSGIQPNGDAMSLSVCVPPFNQREIGDCLESNSDSGSASMDAEPELIDFFDRDTVGEVYVSPNQRVSSSGDFNMEDGIELGLGIGLGSGSGQLGGEEVHREVDSDRVIVGTGVTPVGDNRSSGEEAMVVDEEPEGDNSHNAIGSGQEPVQSNIINLEEEDEDDIAEQYPEWQFFWEVADSLEESADIMEDSGFLDYDIGVFLDIIDVDGENHGDYNAILGQMFENEAGIRGSPPASKKIVDDLPVVEITIEELSNGNIVCAICKDDVVVEDKVKRLPCKHYYHGECIVPWLGMRNTCPVCRYELPTDDLEYEYRRSQSAR